MPARLTEPQLRLWSALNLVALLPLLIYGGLFTLLVVVLGTDHSQTYVDEWALRWVGGAVGGLLVAVVAGHYDRRYRPWAAALMVVGVLAASLLGGSYGGVPLAVVAPVVAVSTVLRARAGHGLDPEHTRARRLRTGVVVTAVAVVLVGLAAAFVVLHTRSTPLYDAMRPDPMAAGQLPGLTVRFDRSKDQTTPLGMPSEAKVDRVWTITDGAARSAKLDELQTMAVDTAWRPGPEPTYCGWTKTVDGFPMCLVIRPGVHPGEVIVTITEDGS